MKELSALVADDEPLARRSLCEHAAALPWLAVVAEACDGQEALEALERLRPDLVFIDVEMPRLSGLEVLARAGHRPVAVITTAFDRYAVAAFELQALDYLLKPFSAERFNLAAERARLAARNGGQQNDPPAAERLRAALGTDGPLRRIFVRARGRIVPVEVRAIARLEAQDDYVAVHAGGAQHLVHLTLGEFERRLDPTRFVRIHRGHIVNVEHVRALEAGEGARLEVCLHDGTRLMASRTRSRELRERVLGRARS
jgi:two-component system LytT family response regulator